MNSDAKPRRKGEIPAYRIGLFLHVEHCASKRGMPCEIHLAYLVAVQAMPHLAAKVYFRKTEKLNKQSFSLLGKIETISLHVDHEIAVKS